MISFNQVFKIFEKNNDRTMAIDNIQLAIKENECFGIIGESGAGKSTLLRMVNALEHPTSGDVFIKDMHINQLRSNELQQLRKQVGMVFQQFNLLNNKTVEENILLPLKLHKYDDVMAVDSLLDFVGLSNKRHVFPKELSGGQKQRVGIARALITKPKILLCDEPTSALDQSTTDEIVQLLKEVNDRFNMTILIVTHELPVVKQLCERAAILEDGKLTKIIPVKTELNPRAHLTYKEQAVEVLTS